MYRVISKLLTFILFTAIFSGCSQKLSMSKKMSCRKSLDVKSISDTNKLLIFGEVHGTKEVPEFMSDITCNLLTSTRREIVFLIEHPVRSQESLKNYISSKGSIQDQVKLVSHENWVHEFQDGRTSESIFRLIDDLRKYNKQTSRLEIEPFADYLSVNADTTIDRAYANKVEDIYSKNPGALLIMLVGNYHGNPNFRGKMSSLLKVPFAYYPFVSVGGTAWNCNPKCGVKIRKNALGIQEATTKLELDSAKKVQHQINIGTSTASNPAKSKFGT